MKEDSKKPSWVRLDHIDLHNHIEWRTVLESQTYKEVLLEVLEWQVNHRFACLETRPHWRSVILRPANSNFIEVIFAWDHTTGDGKSGKIFHDSLLECLNLESSRNHAGPLQGRSFEIPAMALTPPLDHLLKLPVQWNLILSEAWRVLAAFSQSLATAYSATWAPIETKSCTTRLSSLTVDEDALPVVLEACRQHRTTLTGLVHALLLVSMASRLPKGKARAFVSGTPVCLRRFIEASPSRVPNSDMDHVVANSVTYWSYKFEESIIAKIREQISDLKTRLGSDVDLETTVWSVAMALRQDLSKRLKSVTKKDKMGLMGLIGDWRSFFKDEIKKPRTHSWEVSNLGVMNGEVLKEKEKLYIGDKWTIKRATFTQSASVAGPGLCLNLVTVRGKALNITCSWQLEVVDDRLAEGLSSDLDVWLNGLGRTGRIPLDFSHDR